MYQTRKNFLGSPNFGVSLAKRGLIAIFVFAVSSVCYADDKGGDSSMRSFKPAIDHSSEIGSESIASRIVSLTIPEQEIASALIQLGEQTDLSVLVHHDARNVSTGGVNGSFAVRDGLDILLTGTGLEYRIEDDAIIVSRPLVEIRSRQVVENPLSFGKRLRQAAASVVLATAVSAPAAVAAEEAQKPLIEEIIVTAERREENILDVPASMTAFSADQIAALGVTNNDDLENLVPGLQFGENTEGTGHGTVIRGVGSKLSGRQHTDLAVATYIDGAYSVRQDGAIANNFDLERIEVARGPQGTLHGRNSIAGAVSLYSKRPTKEWDLDTLLEVTDQTTQRIGVAGGGPITENLLFRVTAQDYTGDGAQRNIGFGDDFDEPDERSMKGQLRWLSDRLDINLAYTDYEDKGVNRSPVSLFDVTRDQLIQAGQSAVHNWFMYTEPLPSVSSCRPNPWLGTETVDGVPQNVGNWQFDICDDLNNEVNFNRSASRDNQRKMWNFSASWDINESFSLTYTGSDSEYGSITNRDVDGTNQVPSTIDPTVSQDCVDNFGLADCLMIPLSPTETGQPNRFQDQLNVIDYMADEQSHELLFSSNFEGPLNFIVGAYYYENETSYQFDLQDYVLDTSYRDIPLDQPSLVFGFFPADNCAQGLTDFIAPILGAGTSREESPGQWVECGSQGLFNDGDWYRERTAAESETTAFFTHLEYEINERWSISGGLRYTEDKKTLTEQYFALDFDFGYPILIQGDVIALGETLDDTQGWTNDGTWDHTIWNVSLEHKTAADNLVYGRISTGYRAGGFEEFDNDVLLPPFDEETLINYEVGYKGLLFDSRLQVTAAAFFQQYDGYQIRGSAVNSTGVNIARFTGSPLVTYTENVDGTEIWGAEVEFAWYVNERWRLSGYYAYLDSKLGSHSAVMAGAPAGDQELSTEPFPRIDINDGSPFFGEQVCSADWVAANGDYPGLSCFYLLPTDLSGNQLPQQPSHKMALTLQHFMPAGELGRFEFLGTWSYTGEKFASIGNYSEYKLPAYDRLDLRASWFAPSGNVRVTAYVQNVFDDIGVKEFEPSSNLSGAFLGTLTDPRQIGLQIAWQPFANR